MIGRMQPNTEAGVRAAVQHYGAAPGAKTLMDAERAAAEHALETGLYITFRPNDRQEDCNRVGPLSKCFCGHMFTDHKLTQRGHACSQCKCQRFYLMYTRPEEVGQYWLPRRKEFDINTWRPKCKCGHNHEQHDPNNKKCRACTRCYRFESDFGCLICDRHWEEHEMQYETADERRMAGRTTGQDFLPLADTPDIQQMVFAQQGPGAFVRPRGKNVRGKKVVALRKK